MQQIAIGVDLGGTQVRAALVGAAGNLLAQASEPTDAMAGPERVLFQISHLVQGLLEADRSLRPLGVGVSTPGPVDTTTGIASDIPTLAGFGDFPLRAELQRRFDLPVNLENDGISAAIGEWRYGAGKGYDDLVYITVSTGIGGGIVSGGRVLRGRKGMAGHVGHMAIVLDGEACPCGSRGCFEAYASGTAFARRARLLAAGDAQTTLGKNGKPIDSRGVFLAGREGDALANRLIDDEAELLGRGITNLIHILSPELVVIGGGLANEFDRLHPRIRDCISRTAMPAFRDVPVVHAGLGQNSGLIGAAALVFL